MRCYLVLLSSQIVIGEFAEFELIFSYAVMLIWREFKEISSFWRGIQLNSERAGETNGEFVTHTILLGIWVFRSFIWVFRNFIVVFRSIIPVHLGSFGCFVASFGCFVASIGFIWVFHSFIWVHLGVS